MRKQFPISLRYTVAGMLLITVSGITGCSKNKFPDKFKEDRQAFNQSLLSFSEATQMFQQKSGQPSMMRSREQEKRYFELLAKGIKSSGNVTDEFLDFLHPKLKKPYRDSLIQGKLLYYEGSLNGNRIRQLEGSDRQLEWEMFWDAHKTEIAAKLYPKEEQ